jgi:hypothetical protein
VAGPAAAGTGPAAAAIAATASGGPVLLTEVTVTRLPDRLQALARAVQVGGTVIAQQDGSATIRTGAGDVTVQTPTPLPTDRPIVLQLPAAPAAPGTPAAPAAVLLLAPPPATPGGAASGPAGTPTGPAPAPAAGQAGAPAAPLAPSAAALPPALQLGISVIAQVLDVPEPAPPAPPAPAGGSLQPAATTLPATAPVVPDAAPPSPATQSTTPVAAPAPSRPAESGPPAPAVVPAASPAAPATPVAVPPQAAVPTAPAPPVPAHPQAAPLVAAPVPETVAAPAGDKGPPSPLPAPQASPQPAAPPAAFRQAAAPPTSAQTMAAQTMAPQTMAPQTTAAPATPLPAAAPGTGSVETARPVLPPLPLRGAGGLPTLPRSIPLTAPPAPATSLPPHLFAAAVMSAALEGQAPTPVRPTAARPAAAAPAGAEAAPDDEAARIASPFPQRAPVPVAPLLRPGATVRMTVVALAAQPQGQAAAPIAAAAGAQSLPAEAPEATAPEDAIPSPPAAPLRLAGHLAGITAAGRPVVTTPAATLLLNARTELPAGTPIVLTLEAPDAAEGPAAPPALDPLRGRGWPALKEMFAVLAAGDPHLAHAVAHAVLPQPGPRLTTALVAFLAALRGGDAQGWLGSEAADTVDRAGRRDVLAQLADDFRAVSRQGTEPLAGDWRAVTIPFGTPDGLQTFQLAVRRPGADDGAVGAERTDRRRRFLIDVEFTRLGPMQLDGLTGAGQLDLVIRTQQLLPAALKGELTTIFSGSLEAVGFAGRLAFQTGSHAWVQLRPAARAAASRVG